MKKIISLVLAMIMMLALAACGGNEDKEAQTDMEYVKEKGTLVVGITDFEPMDYKEGNSDEWVGFDADMAKAFAESLGVKVEFVEIDWGQKVTELKNKNIDVVWNGMTLNDEVKASMDCSNAYCNNAQVVVLKKDIADKYTTVESLKDLNFAVEIGSAGKNEVEALEYSFTEVDKQATALAEVSGGTSDAAVIDALMAAAMVGEGTGYENLTTTVRLNAGEEYGVGFRQGSDLVAELNNFFATSYADGSMKKIAEKYALADYLVEQ